MITIDRGLSLECVPLPLQSVSMGQSQRWAASPLQLPIRSDVVGTSLSGILCFGVSRARFCADRSRVDLMWLSYWGQRARVGVGWTPPPLMAGPTPTSLNNPCPKYI